ncbi:Uma2 family endonuclease [Luedemannella helvata]|uniref:Uma2 family endonuclease n=1 Tax=Luedemannella helvata TaxID=349315 RepID=UPI0031DFD3B0
MTTQMLPLPSDGALRRTDFDNLPEAPDGWAWELHDGVLELKPMPVSYWHAEIILMLLLHWRARGRKVAAEQRVADSGYVGGGTTRNNRVADGVVFIDGHVPAADDATHSPDVIDVIIEAVSSTSEDRDSVDKLALYAELGIRHYWIVRQSPGEAIDGVVSMYDLVGGRYELVGTTLASAL